ncbi:MAG: bifunctional (p)ppGpp synthetase/guanosine-3',5'-bis(diphosphate) 3'-pyrophosphohydrolase [Chloroflexi bacterium]|nr:bifunctional (p)ppGpp synthetase/guanosine-3',5'-bis(diphosphate) 3'-pyrophosphohydrolase [Chloroflexota bacterium]
MAVDLLLDKAREYIPEERLRVISEAYAFAESAHHGQVRLSGEAFIEHPVQTALFLADLRLDASALAAALLHDVVEDCDVQSEDLEKRFGPEISKLVDGVTKLTQTELVSSDQSQDLRSSTTDSPSQAATLRKMLMAMAEDIRVVLIKLADRLHNMRTLDAQPEDRRIAIAQETLDIYAPLAHRLGIWEIKWSLEDLSFQHLDPVAYRECANLINGKRAEREEYIEKVLGILRAELDRAGIAAEVTGRPKHLYSLHKKIQSYAKQSKEVGEIYDLFALRILANEVQDCYAALGVVHTLWHPLPGQFDDYIANPKDNLYQSLHTTILCEDACPVEVQVRTHDMHQVAEYGVAAHWLYKEGSTSDERFEEKMTWLRQLLEWQRDVSGAEEFVESFKTDVFQSQVFVYTPKGDLKELPAGSTPLDFAYRIHTDVGHSCIGAKVNGKLVSLHYQLQNGDTVLIMTSKTVKGPSLDWLNPNLGNIKTTSAREKIRQWFNRQERKINIERGQDLLRKQLRRLSVRPEDVEVARLMKFDSTDELFAALGNGTVSVSRLASGLASQDVGPEQVEERAVPVSTYGPASGIEVLGVGDLLTRIASCCAPIYGDEIIGYITRSRGVTVHRRTCSNIVAETEVERLVPVAWGKTQHLYPVRIQIEAYDRVGLLRDITSLVSDEGVNIASCVSEERDDVSVVTLTVYINGTDQLNLLFSKLEGVKGVTSVSRARP